MKLYNISGACNGTIDVPVNDTAAVPLCKKLATYMFRWLLQA